MLQHTSSSPLFRLSLSHELSKLHFLALSLLLGFELSYYLLIVQTGIAQHYHSNLVQLLPLFVGGVVGTLVSGMNFKSLTQPIHKIYLALGLQLILSFIYPHYNPFTLVLLGVSVGMMAPLGIYLFKEKQGLELLLALAIAYSVGTYGFTSFAEERTSLAIGFTFIALLSAFVLKDYKVEKTHTVQDGSVLVYLPLILWVLLDSNLFETLSRHEGLDIWSHRTFTIIVFHLLGLVGAYFIRMSSTKQHLFIALLFLGSYGASYLQMPFALALIYPFCISYYNVIVFRALTKEQSLAKLAIMMVFIGWIASGMGLGLALSQVLH